MADRCCVWLLVACLSLSSGAPAWAQPVASSPPVAAWLLRHAKPITPVGPVKGNAELNAFRAAFLEARVVGLGEATHGTREFFQLKHRLVQLLVQEFGFTVLALEAAGAELEPLDDYVVEGKGDLHKALTSQRYFVYDTVEFTETLKWLRSYNARTPRDRRVHVVGLDMMMTTRARERVIDYVSTHAPERLADTRQVLAVVADEETRVPINTNRERIMSVLPQLQALRTFLVTERERQRGRDAGALETVITDATRIMQWSLAHYPVETPGFVSRSRAMGQNLLDVLDRTPGAKAIAWAYNGHVAPRRPAGRHSMGTELRARFGEAYYAVSFELDSGTTQVRPADADGLLSALGTVSLPPAPKGSLTRMLAEQASMDYFIDLRASGPRPDDVDSWLKTEGLLQRVGWAPKAESPTTASDTLGDYDGIVFLRTTSPARPTPGAVAAARRGGGI